MTMQANGSTMSAEDEAVHYGMPEATEWETHETQYSNPYSSPEAEWEEEVHYSTPEAEWETHETHYSNPYSSPEAERDPFLGNVLGAIGGALGLESEYEDFASPEAEWEEEVHYSTPEAEWETHETHYSNPYSTPEAERADQFLPFLAPLALKALPLIGKAVLPMARKLIPFGKRAVSGVLRNVMGGAAPRPGMRPAPAATARPAAVAFRPPMPSVRAQRATVSNLFRQLAAIFGEGESEAAELEAQLFGASEMEGELAAHENAHEAALTEVLAAEAAHTASEAEAEALLGTALPITIRVMSGTGAVRRVMPTLARANARLVRGIRRSSPAGPQLLRTVPAIQRRTVASLRAAQRAGQPITPSLAARIMAGQAARVLATPHLCGRAIVRNAAVRRATVAPAGRAIRPRRPLRAESY